MDQWLSGPKSPGLIILEHELADLCVQAFMDNYPKMLQNGWKIISVSQLVTSTADNSTGNVYWNAQPGNQGTPTSIAVVDRGLVVTTVSSTSTSTTSSAANTEPTTKNLGKLRNRAGKSIQPLLQTSPLLLCLITVAVVWVNPLGATLV